MEESEARIQADNSERRKLREKQYQCIDRFVPYGHYVTVFIIVSGKLTAASVMVKNALPLARLVWKPMKTNYRRVSIIK